MMAARLRWGILGTGWIAREQTADLVSNGFTVTAVGSRSRDSAEAFAGQYRIATAHASYEALVADPEVDVVYVATPHPYHAPNALLALNAGKHVLLEKPFAMNAAEAEAVVALAEASGLVVLEAMWTRFLPHMQRIRDIIAAGALGEVRTVIADHGQRLSADPAHRINDPALGGGALLDLGIYPVSFAYDVFGAPTRVLASASMTETGVDRQNALVFEFAGGRQAILQSALDARGPTTASVIGTLGRIEIDSVWYIPTSFTAYSGQQVLERYEHPVAGRGMQYQAWELERRVRAGQSESDVLPPRESVQIMRTLDEIRRQIGLRYPADAGDGTV